MSERRTDEHTTDRSTETDRSTTVNDAPGGTDGSAEGETGTGSGAPLADTDAGTDKAPSTETTDEGGQGGAGKE